MSTLFNLAKTFIESQYFVKTATAAGSAWMTRFEHKALNSESPDSPRYWSCNADDASLILSEYLGRDVEPGRPITNLTHAELVGLIMHNDDIVLPTALFSHSNAICDAFFGDKVHFRGLIEFSNECAKNCFYCGLRRGRETSRYSMSRSEILDACVFAHENRYGSVMLQSGEIPTQKRVDWLSEIVSTVRSITVAMDDQDPVLKERSKKGLGIALSVGELTKDQYKQLYDAGAHRYLLRFEASDRALYGTLHPNDGFHAYDRRFQALRDMKKVGFMTGTGVMIGTPGQTVENLASDLLAFAEYNIDMIGMGPYLTQEDTPTKVAFDKEFAESGLTKGEFNMFLYELTCRMLALVRTTLGNVNLAATTALQTLCPNGGREIALNRGCNVIMPMLTPTVYREQYQLYTGKPSTKDDASSSLAAANAMLATAGKTVAWGEYGDPPKYFGDHSTMSESEGKRAHDL